MEGNIDLKATYEIVNEWWQFTKEMSDKEITVPYLDKWFNDADTRYKELVTQDEGLAWLYMRLGLDFVEYVANKSDEREGRKVEWKIGYQAVPTTMSTTKAKRS